MAALKPATQVAAATTATEVIALRVLSAGAPAAAPDLGDHSCDVFDPLTGRDMNVLSALRRAVTFALPEECAGSAAEEAPPAGDTHKPAREEAHLSRPILDSSFLRAGGLEPMSSLEYYRKLGFNKLREDVQIQRRMNLPGAAYAYLEEMLRSPEPLTAQTYINVQTLLSGEGATLRTKSTTTWVRTPLALSQLGDKLNNVNLVGALSDIKRNDWVEAEHVIQSIDKEGSYAVYKMRHNKSFIAEKLKAIIEEFNFQILAGFNKEAKFVAIATFFNRCELLQPVAHNRGVAPEMPSSRRVNVALLNYLLAKHGFPCAIFKEHLRFMHGELVSTVDSINFPNFLTQLKYAMKRWCGVAKVPFEEF